MKRFISLMTVLSIAILTIAEDIPTKFYVWVKNAYIEYSIGSEQLVYSQNGEKLAIGSDTYNVSDIDSITFAKATTDDDVDTVYVTYNGTSATVSALPEGITGTIDGANVSLTNTITDREIVSVLSGSSSSGSFVYNGDYKTTIRLNGLTLTGSTEEAIHIKDGKRVALELADGTKNTLADASTDGGQKAAFYTKGHLEISGSGSLNLTGNIKHALASKEYMLIKKTAGTITVTKAATDGIHCGQYFQMNGGTVTISGIGADGIQAEMAEDSTEDDGKVIIKGGTINVTTTADDAAAIKADSTLHIKDGTITLKSTGAGSKCLKSSQDILIEGGSMNITQSGGLYDDSSEETSGSTTEETKSYKVYVSIPSNNMGGGGFGGGNSGAWSTVYLYKSDGTLVQQLTNSVTVTSGYSSATFYYYDFKASDSGTYYFKSDNYSSRNNTYTIKSSTFSGPTSGSDVYYSISNSYSTSGTTRTYSISNVTSTYANGSTTTTEGDLSSSHGIKGDAGVTISGGTIVETMSGTASKGISSDNDITVTGGNITITNTAAGQSSGTTAYTAKGFSADGNIALEGGTIKVTMSGSGGKGIKADGTFTEGVKGSTSGPSLTVSTTGSTLSTSSTGNGGMGGPGGMMESTGSSAKAIKAQNTIYLYGGTTEISTSTDGAEGLESKTAIYVEGGNHYLKCYDDCINSNGCIYFNGGVCVCYGFGNDAVDSNAGSKGAITIGNGTVFAYSTKGAPEEGLDCDNISYMVINGTGTAISAGGAQGGGSSSSSISSATQGYSISTSTISYTTGRYYTLADASNNNLITYSFEGSCSSTMSFFTATGMKSSSKYTVKYSTSAPTDATTAFHGLYLGSSATGTTSVTSFTAK